MVEITRNADALQAEISIRRALKTSKTKVNDRPWLRDGMKLISNHMI